MATKYADNPATDNAKKVMEAEQKAVDASRAAYESKMKGKPTPTQEELNISNCGGQILEHEADGSDLDPGGQTPASPGTETRHMEASHSGRGNYQTRSGRHTAE